MTKTTNHTAPSVKFGRNDFMLLRNDAGHNVQYVEGCSKVKLFNYELITKMPVSISESDDSKLLIIGEIFSAERPEYSNQEMAASLVSNDSFDAVLSELRECTGRYVVFRITPNSIWFVGDAMGQFEVYYSDDFSGIASNLNVLSYGLPLCKRKGDSGKLYKRIAATTRIQIGTTTPFVNVSHLMPNHYANSDSKLQIRYFPTEHDLISKLTLDEAATRIESRMQKFAEAMNHRCRLALPLTAGRDSRYLLAIFRKFDLKLFVFKHPHATEDHYDIKTGKALASYVNKDYDIIRYDAELNSNDEARLNSFSERPRDNPTPYLLHAYPRLDNFLIVNGHGGEIGRSFFGTIYNINSKKLSTLLGYPKSSFVENEMKKWLMDIEATGDAGENLIDYFYWEQRMGNWGARIKTETANVVDMVAPMNSISILSCFLAVPRKHRKYYSNELFDVLIKRADPKLHAYPFNPSRKNRVIQLLIRLGIYWIYRNIRLNFRTYL